MTLAYVLITITSPALYAGEELITTHPVECAASVDRFLSALEANGFTADAKCFYTSAPVTSPRPQPRGARSL